MSKRPAGQRAPDRAQTDLFGAAAAQVPQMKARPAPRSHPHMAQAPSPPAPASAAKGAASANGLLNVRQAAARLGLSKSTLDKMRCGGKGPRFVKSTDRAIRYDPADLDAWISARRRSSTGEG